MTLSNEMVGASENDGYCVTLQCAQANLRLVRKLTQRLLE